MGCQQQPLCCCWAGSEWQERIRGQTQTWCLVQRQFVTCLMMLRKNLVPPALAASSHYQLIGPRCSHCWNLLSGASCYMSAGAPWEGCLCPQTAWGSQRLQLHKIFPLPHLSWGQIPLRYTLARLIGLLTRVEPVRWPDSTGVSAPLLHQKSCCLSPRAVWKVGTSVWRNLSLALPCLLWAVGNLSGSSWRIRCKTLHTACCYRT